MIKLIVLLGRRPELGWREFEQRWLRDHAPLAARLPGLKRYVQNHVLAGEREREAPPDFDGVAELWWDDLDSYRAARASPEFAEMAASARTIAAGIRPLLAREVVLLDGVPAASQRAGLVKYIGMLLLADGVAFDRFQPHWRDVHGPIMVDAFRGRMQRYVQNHLLPEMFEGPDPSPYGGVPMAWLDSVEAMSRRPRDPRAPRNTGDPEWPRVCAGSNAIFARELPILG